MMLAKKWAGACGAVLGMAASVRLAAAHCPLCTAGIGAAAVSAGYFGLDVSIIGLLVGAFGLSTGMWVGKKVRKQYIRGQLPLIVAVSFLLTVVPLRGVVDGHVTLSLLLAGAPGSVLNRQYFVDKLLLGSVIGAAVSLAAWQLHVQVKKVRGSVLVPYQGVIFMLAALLLAGTVMFVVAAKNG